jgi:hypothetical protein
LCSFTLGNGDNTATITNAPAGLLRWKSGNGSNTLTMALTTDLGWNVNIQFGNGDDTFALAGTGNEIIVGRADGGRVMANTFTQGANWELTASSH